MLQVCRPIALIGFFPFQLKGDQPPLLKDVAAKVFEYLQAIDSQDQVELGRRIMEGLFSHFFSPHTPQPYNLDDCQWFLEFANRQKSWSKNMRYFDSLPSTQPQLHPLSTEVQHEAGVSMNVCKMFLLRILQHKQEVDQPMNAGPLGIYKPKVTTHESCGQMYILIAFLSQAREHVGEVLTTNTALGHPAQYIPPFYQQLPFKRDILCEVYIQYITEFSLRVHHVLTLDIFRKMPLCSNHLLISTSSVCLSA